MKELSAVGEGNEDAGLVGFWDGGVVSGAVGGSICACVARDNRSDFFGFVAINAFFHARVFASFVHAYRKARPSVSVIYY